MERDEGGIAWGPVLTGIGGMLLVLVLLLVGLFPTWTVLAFLALVIVVGAILVLLARFEWLTWRRPRLR